VRTHIDWLSFTCNPLYVGGNQHDLAAAIVDGLCGVIGKRLFNVLFAGEGEQRPRSRAPYSFAWAWDKDHVVVYASENLNHFTVEISGQGCERLLESNHLVELLNMVDERVTRIDIACDIETQIDPPTFVSNISHKRMQASGHQKSASGETCYVGSQKSERYARVYRYNKPHPRAHLLRIEHVFRRDHAKVVARAVVENGVENVADAAGKAFGWSHDVWKQGGGGNVDISVVTAERNAGKTLYWMVNSCAPAFKRLCEDGVIRDPDEFIRRYFLLGNKDA